MKGKKGGNSLIRGPTWQEVGGGGAVAEGPDMR